mmetsp:Transcript_23034/g.46267  ORF Transcript_23034/g.46267 Transcript_23034/m.46267 type:complete len:359 (-) Transcript_23034:41-1117(-)
MTKPTPSYVHTSQSKRSQWQPSNSTSTSDNLNCNLVITPGMDCQKRNSITAFESEESTLTKPPEASKASANTTVRSVLKKDSSARKRHRVSFCNSIPSPSSDSPPSPPKKVQTMKHSVSCNALPIYVSAESDVLLVSDASTGELDPTVSPAAFVKTIVVKSRRVAGPLCGGDLISIASNKLKSESYFLTLTDEQQQAYDTMKVNAVHNDDLEALRSLHEAGHTMQTSNRFGESLLHTACRRSFTDIVEFFINEAGVSPRIRDDMGRTPMHDCCWSSAAPNHEVMKLLIRTAPEMLLSKDKRGHSPFDYARREYWPNWVAFLNDNRQFLLDSLVSSCADDGKEFGTYGVGNGKGIYGVH